MKKPRRPGKKISKTTSNLRAVTTRKKTPAARRGSATRRQVRAAAEAPGTSSLPLAPEFPLLPPTEVLRAIVALSRAAGGDMNETDLARVVYSALRELLPGRRVAVRTFHHKTLATTAILADDPLIEGAAELPITIERGGLEYQYVRDNLPVPGDETSAARIQVVDAHPLIFRDVFAGFSVPLLAGGEISGEVHVNYPGAREKAAQVAAPVRQDKGLVIPIANHMAVVAHTRRLLRETSYLRDYLDHLIDQANVLIVATDLSGRLTVWNRAMNRLSGIRRDEAVGKDLVQWSSELGSPQLGLVMRQVAATGESATRELRLPTAGGTVLRAAFNVVIVKQGNQPAAVLAIGQDVTALRALQDQVVHAEKLATLGQIAAGVAHEINNPLTSIQLCAEAVSRKAVLAKEGRIPNAFDDADIDRLSKIKEGAERIRRFAKELVTFARPSRREREVIDVNGLIEQALSFCEHPLAGHGARLEKDFHAALPPIRAVRDQLLQVMINLINNAAQALPKGGGVVRLRTWKKGNAVIGIAVSDNGKGIKDADRPHIFEPFFSTKAPGQGTGLGLSIVRNIVYSQGGQINFQSRYGGGTTFVLTLPVTQTENPGGASGDDSDEEHLFPAHDTVLTPPDPDDPEP